jgi:hypothetical protein
MTEEEKRKARNAYMREYMRRRYAESEEFRKKRREWNKPSTLRYIKAHPDRVKARQRRYHERLKAGKAAEYLRMFQELDGRVRYIGCNLELDNDTMEVTGKSVALKDFTLMEVWTSDTYSARVPWLLAVSFAYKQFRKLRGVKQRRMQNEQDA